MKRNTFLLLTLLMGLSSLPQDATAGRMYDPEISRFMSIDPILNKKAPNKLQKLAGGQVYSNSPYNYTFNNPINLVDPDGNFPIAPAIPWLIAAAEMATPYIVATAGAASAALGFQATAEAINDYLSQSSDSKGKTGSGDSKTIGTLELPGDLNIRVDVEFPDATSAGEVHLQLDGKGAKGRKPKQRVENKDDVLNKKTTDLPNKVRGNEKLGRLIEKGLRQLEKAREDGHNGYSGGS